MNKIKVTFLGTNGWFSTSTGKTLCILLETAEYYIILDAGEGIEKLAVHITDWSKPAYMFLSHFHLDHISGLHQLNNFKFKKGLTICGHIGAKAILRRLLNQPYSMNVKSLPFKVTLKDLPSGENAGFPFRLESRELEHTSKCLGFR